jgi:hypothetical protein
MSRSGPSDLLTPNNMLPIPWNQTNQARLAQIGHIISSLDQQLVGIQKNLATLSDAISIGELTQNEARPLQAHYEKRISGIEMAKSILRGEVQAMKQRAVRRNTMKGARRHSLRLKKRR